jgi:hypothetical protein
MKRISLTEFIKQHRKEIDEAIKRAVPNNQYFNDEERRQWVLNDPGLYGWARSSGVNI